ncbi:hypothetical protein C8R46DRAFT_1216568 [Mycena filopes]|nr:hypothetical protein C8R46DRAFT_1216568 [Mycena filopes]
MQALTRVKSEAYRKCNHLKFRQPFSIANAESYIEERLPCNDILISSKQGLLNLDADVSSECLQTQPKRAKGLPFRLRVRGAGTSSTKFHGGLGIEGGPSRKASGTTSNWISVGSQTIINNAVHGGVEAQPQAFLRHVPYARLVDTKILEGHDHQFLTDFPISYIDTDFGAVSWSTPLFIWGGVSTRHYSDEEQAIATLLLRAIYELGRAIGSAS